MKIEHKMDISSKEFYDFLIENLKKEMGVNGKLKKGMKFSKKLVSKTNQVTNGTVEIMELSEGKEYTLKYFSPLGENVVKYTMEDICENKMSLIYEEKYITNSFFKKYNNMLMELCFYFILKKRKIKMLREIEKYIVDKRKEDRND